MSLMKKCKGCPAEKLVSEFPIIKSRGKEYRSNFCHECMQQKQKEYQENNKEAKKKRDKEYYERVKNTPEFVEKSKVYRDKNKEHKQEYDKNYRATHQEEYKEYCVENAEEIAKARHDYYVEHKEERKAHNQEWYADNKDRKHAINAKYVMQRLQEDMSFRLRHNVSRTINKYLKLSNSSKNGNSILDFLPYTMQGLKTHLEKQFEPWMSWDNYGSYCADKWNDNDSTTWAWQIDHVIPQSKLLYASMADDNFKKCWALENLRPLSAKQNLLDGVRKIR